LVSGSHTIGFCDAFDAFHAFDRAAKLLSETNLDGFTAFSAPETLLNKCLLQGLGVKGDEGRADSLERGVETGQEVGGGKRAMRGRRRVFGDGRLNERLGFVGRGNLKERARRLRTVK
jgi:hypothetical protein